MNSSLKQEFVWREVRIFGRDLLVSFCHESPKTLMNSDSGNPYCPELRNHPYMANDGSKFPIFTIPKGKKRSCDSHLRFNTAKKKQLYQLYHTITTYSITITTMNGIQFMTIYTMGSMTFNNMFKAYPDCFKGSTSMGACVSAVRRASRIMLSIRKPTACNSWCTAGCSTTAFLRDVWKAANVSSTNEYPVFLGK